MNFNVNFNILQSKYIVYPLVKIKKDFDTHIILLKRHSIDTESPRHVAAPKVPTSGSTTDTCQQQGQQYGCRVRYYRLLNKLNFTSGNSFCWPLC